jgi:hypothetical protein
MFSALPLTTDIAQHRRHVGKVPNSDITSLHSITCRIAPLCCARDKRATLTPRHQQA